LDSDPRSSCALAACTSNPIPSIGISTRGRNEKLIAKRFYYVCEPGVESVMLLMVTGALVGGLADISLKDPHDLI
jgi:hypothetical protein